MRCKCDAMSYPSGDTTGNSQQVTNRWCLTLRPWARPVHSSPTVPRQYMISTLIMVHGFRGGIRLAEPLPLLTTTDARGFDHHDK